ncbi:SDR family oxidoreductase [Kineococcus sp. R86509]|uniref:SDR family oxidoreductase n=1 Tax=Kineococcus sp. R86509 TaxID=3093851 RepID=UPI0036D40070
MTFIVHGATGAQGAPVAAALTHAGHHVTAAVRTPSAYTAGPAIAVDYADVASLTAAYQGAEGVFIHLPLGSPDQRMAVAVAVAEALEQAHPARVVLSTSGYPLQEGSEQTAIGVLAARLAAGGIPTAVIAPRIYLENLLLPPVTGPVREEGVLRYPIREDYAVSWSSHLDVADVAVRLFQDTSVTGVVAVGALPGLLGADLAAGFAAYLGREVRFEFQEPEDFGTAVTPLFGAEAIAPVVASYHWRRTQLHELIDEAASAQLRLGQTPRSVEQWLRDVSA